MRMRSKYLEEKLTAADPTSKWISDFVYSDNPKFAGKSKKERIRMALGASYAAKGQSRNENFVIKHKTSGQILSTHESEDSAKDEHSALSNREDYVVTRSKMPAREFSVKEQRQLHRVNVTVTDPKHPATTMRNTKIQKIVALSADDKEHAVTKAKQYYKDRGYKVHDHLYMGLKEETPAATPSVAKRGRPKTAKRVAEDVGSNDLLEYSEDLQKMRKADSYKVGDKIWTKVGGQWHKGHITTSLNKAGNHGVKFQHGGKTHSYVSSPDQLRLQVDEAQVHKVVKQEVEQLSELDKEPGGTLHRYLAKAGGPEGRQRRIKAAMDNPSKLKKINTGIKSAETKIEKERQKQTGMNPQYRPEPKLSARDIQKMDMRYTHEEYETVPASKALQKAHDDERRKRGLPDPDYYLKLAAQKKKEIEDMKKEEVEKMNEEEAKEPLYHFQQTIASILKKHPDANERNKLAKHHADAMKKSNPKFDHEGFLKAAGVMKEEVEQIDELKKSTLASYAKKASHDARIKMATGKDFERHAITSRKSEYKAGAKEWEDKYKSDARRREVGVNRAIDKLAKEEVERVDELKKSTLGSYVSKASVDMANRTAEGERKRTLAGADYAHNISRGMSVKTAEAGMKKDYAAAKPDVNKAVKRMRGIDKAVGRLAKEEVELDESGGPVVWKRGKDHIEKYGDDKFALYVNGIKTKYYKTIDAAKSALKEETKKATGGLKDACWKGYTAVGLKKKDGKMVPNCVPVKEEITFKSLREKLNGNH